MGKVAYFCKNNIYENGVPIFTTKTNRRKINNNLTNKNVSSVKIANYKTA
jgi:hypothetical protein